jgi:hypothetical protein
VSELLDLEGRVAALFAGPACRRCGWPARWVVTRDGRMLLVDRIVLDGEWCFTGETAPDRYGNVRDVVTKLPPDGITPRLRVHRCRKRSSEPKEDT